MLEARGKWKKDHQQQEKLLPKNLLRLTGEKYSGGSENKKRQRQSHELKGKTASNQIPLMTKENKDWT